MTDYNTLNKQMQSIMCDIKYRISVLANASALLFQAIENLNWAGFYLLEDDRLVLGPFQGNVACMEIPIGKGVCGCAVEQNRTLVVDNVHCFKGHIACDSKSLSEIVIPIRKNGKIVGVLDIDSPLEKRFSDKDRVGLEQFVRVLESVW